MSYFSQAKNLAATARSQASGGNTNQSLDALARAIQNMCIGLDSMDRDISEIKNSLNK